MNLKEQIEYKDYLDIEAKLDIRIGTITEAERVPKSHKLLKLSVQFGTEIKTVVTALGENLEPESFLNKKMPFVMNLVPSKMMGIVSEAMIVVAKNDKGEIELDNYSSGSQLI